MIHNIAYLPILLLSLIAPLSLQAQSDENVSLNFMAERGNYMGVSLPYRKAVIIMLIKSLTGVFGRRSIEGYVTPLRLLLHPL